MMQIYKAFCGKRILNQAIYATVRFSLISCFNPLRPNNDLSQTSHCHIKGVSVSDVMRIENKITPVKLYDILTASPHYFCEKCMETQKENL